MLSKTIKTRLTKIKLLSFAFAVFFLGMNNKVNACSPLNIPTINNWNIVGNNIVLNASSNTIYNCTYSIQVELVCNNNAFTATAPFYYTSPGYAKNATPFVIPTMNIPIGNLCAGTQYKFRIREVYGGFTFSGWTATQVFTTPGNFVQPTVIASSNPPSICLPQTAQLSAVVNNGCGGGPLTYSWAPGASLSCITCSNPIASPVVTTQYTVWVGGGPTGCWTASAVVNVVVSTSPPSVGTVTAPASVCYGTAATVAINSFSGSIKWLSAPSSTGPWTIIATNTSSIITPTLSATTCFQASVTGCNSTLTSNTVCININPSPTITVNSPNICQGATAVLTAGGAGNYTWSAGANAISATSATVAPLVNTSYTVWGTALGCMSYAVSNVTVNPIPVLNTANVSICVAQNLSLTVNSVPAATFAWSGPLAYSSTLQNPVILNAQANMSGPYQVVGTTTAGCSQTVIANAQVIPLPTITVVGNNTVCSQNFNGSTNTVLVTSNGASNYTWTLPGGYSTPNLTVANIVVTPPVVGVLSVGTLSVFGISGTCTNSTTFNLTVLPNPILATVSSSMCAGTSATISATGATTYTWSPPTALNTIFGATVVGNPTITSVYSVIGTSVGCHSQAQNAIITVVANPTVSITPFIPPICAGTTTIINANGASSYTWTLGSPTNTTTGNSISITPFLNTQYTLLGELATCTAIAAIDVTVIPLPTIMVVADKTVICEGDKANINANGANNYVWSPGNTLNTTTSNFVVASPAVTTTYFLTGNNGICIGTTSITINVVPKPLLQLSVNPTKICQGASAMIFASGAQNYSMSPMSTLNTFTNSTAVATPSASTNYTVMGYNTTGTLTCTFTKEILLQVIPTITATVSRSVEICEGESIGLNAGGSSTYLWMPKGSLNNNNIPNPIANPVTTTIYTVNISEFNFCTVTASVLVKVNPTPTVSAGVNSTFNSDEPMQIIAKGTGTITWIAGEDIICAVCPITQIMPKNSGCYKAQAINEFGCKAFDDVCIEVTNNYNIYIPNVFTPNEDGLNETFKVHGTGISDVTLIIYDRWGEKLATTTDMDKGWDGSYKGKLCKNEVYVYLVTFTSLDGKKHTRKGHVTLLK